MKNIRKQVERFILENTSWMFLAVIVFFSTLFIQNSRPQTWAVYLNYIGSFCLAFAPILIFALFRASFQKLFTQTVYRIVWAVVFVVYPLVFWLTNSYVYFDDMFSYHIGIQDNHVASRFIFLFVIILLFLTEMVVQFNDRLFKQNFNYWIKKISLEKSILILMLLFSVFVISANYPKFQTSTDFWIQTKELTFYIIDFFLILLLYYIFYLINHYFLINRLLQEKGLIYYFYGFIALLFIGFPILSQLIYYVQIVQDWKVHPVNDGRIFSEVNLATPLIGMLISIPFILAFQWYKQQNKITALEKEKSETELNLLKQQINPHFFFNTLNNLYALSLKNDKQTPEVILQLSDLMRYVIYKGKEAQVLLSEEIQYIEDYIQLQLIRLHKQLDFKFEKEIENERLLIPPLLFIILVENAFKHGIEPAEDNCFLHIHIEQTSEKLVFRCENSFEERNLERVGIGLENLRKRMELLYPNRFSFEVMDTENTFDAILTINLDEQ